MQNSRLRLFSGLKLLGAVYGDKKESIGHFSVEIWQYATRPLLVP